MQRLLAWLVRILAPHWKISPVVAQYLAAAGRLGRSDHMPSEWIPIAALLWGRGWLNRNFFETHQDWVLPYWAVHQLSPSDPGFVARGWAPVVLNMTRRDWTTVGNLESSSEGIVDPRGLVTPQPLGDSWSLDIWLWVDGEPFFPSHLEPPVIQQRLHESLPLVQTRYEAHGLRVSQEVFAARAQDRSEWIAASATVENPRGQPREATLYLSPRPFNPEGVSLIRQVEFRPGDGAAHSFWINGALGGIIPPPDSTGCSDGEQGDVASQAMKLNGETVCKSAAGIASGAAAYKLQLAPHTSRTVTAVLPLSTRRETSEEAASWTLAERYTQLRRETSAAWRQALARGMRIQVPDEEMQESFEANKAFLLLLHDGASITPGPFTYHEFWFRDAAFMLNALDQLGYHEATAEVLKSYPGRLQKTGYFLAEEGEWDSNGQALWSIAQNARLSGDLEVMAHEYWPMLNAAHWIDAERQKTKGKERTPHFGLLPHGTSAEHLGPNDYYYWDDLWGLAGLRAVQYAARIFDKKQDQEKLGGALDTFRRDIEASLACAAERNGAIWMPASPYRRADSAMVANLVGLYPLQLLAPDDPRITATLEELRRVAWREDALFHDVGHSGFGTYLSLAVAGCYLYQRSAKAWPIIRWLLKHASPTYTWAEAIHPLTHAGGMGDGHHGWTAGDWISIIRNALLFEEGEHLVLTPALPEEWTFETMSLKVERAATCFGGIDYTLAFGERAATLALRARWRNPPEYIEWNLPYELKTAGGDCPGVEIVNNRVHIPSQATKIVATW